MENHWLIVFVYKCINKKPFIYLFKNKSGYRTFSFQYQNLDEAIKKFSQITGIIKENCYPNRFFESFHSITVQKEKIKYKIKTTSVRLIDDYQPYSSFFENAELLPIDQAYEKLKSWKDFSRSFKKEFLSNNTFWHCLDTNNQKNKN